MCCGSPGNLDQGLREKCARCPSQPAPRTVLAARLFRPDGRSGRVLTIDANSPTFTSDLTLLFEKNVAELPAGTKESWHPPVASAEETNMIIAIDGPAASGKGTLGKRLAAHYGLRHLDTGLLYRAVAQALRAGGHRLDDPVKAAAAARAIEPASFDEVDAQEP